MDLAIGLTQIRQKLKGTLGGANGGINDMGTYCKILKTEDFARSLSHKQVPGLKMTYGQYLDVKDTIETIIEHINYNYSNKKDALTISFTDRDAVVAAQMLDSITVLLQEDITLSRQVIIDAAIRNCQEEQEKAKAEYLRALQNYTRFSWLPSIFKE